MSKFCVTALSVAILGVSMVSASALTLPSGSVITDEGEVVQASESPTTQKVVELQGYAIVGQNIVVGGVEKGFHQLTLEEAQAVIRSELNPELQEAFEGMDAETIASVKDALESGDVTIDQLNRATEAFGADCVDPSNPCGLTEDDLSGAGVI